ncbi:hypothetical protein C8Q78DRAFT_987203 [Trametes maxima]|nr:hypothetical protein C8Q78DRAFT_987203 [Trametes maxima]
MKCPILPLNDTIVVCIGGGDNQASNPPSVVQISCKTERPEDVETITTYFLVQHELSELALRLVNAHLEQSVPESLTFEGDLYIVDAKHTPWTFGKEVAFLWGDRRLEACEDKWTFWFKIKKVATCDGRTPPPKEL